MLIVKKLFLIIHLYFYDILMSLYLILYHHMSSKSSTASEFDLNFNISSPNHCMPSSIPYPFFALHGITFVTLLGKDPIKSFIS